MYTAWGKQYGELTFLSAFGRTLLIVNSFEAAVDLLDKRGHLYSDRPRMVMAGEMMGTLWEAHWAFETLLRLDI